jgi:hypothetical protein
MLVRVGLLVIKFGFDSLYVMQRYLLLDQGMMLLIDLICLDDFLALLSYSLSAF